jgi:glycosyltransferase involved in cell wall biosynthesis
MKKIAVVNVLFPPKALGGATRIAVDETTVLLENYSDEFEVVVFTTDLERRPAYDLTVYPYNGFRVYAASAHINNWLYQDQEMAEIFGQFLDFEKPDLVHFHCIQILTGSIVEATRERGIPYLITVHDAWWISDFQFLQDASGKVYLNGHPDPFELFDLPNGVTLNQSIKRRSYLKNLLLNADKVLTVSETYRRLYEKNGVRNAITNKNGVSNEVEWRKKNTSYTNKIVCAHIGGMSAHKGFDIFKAAVHALPESNIEILIVDHSKSSYENERTYWGKTPVLIIGHVNQENIASLYGRIDVLFAPSVCPESFGLVTREAAACGCWIVASDVGGIGEDVTAENGFKVMPTEKNLLYVLKEIDQSPEKYKRISNTLSIRYSSDQVSELVEVFRTVIAKHERILDSVVALETPISHD